MTKDQWDRAGARVNVIAGIIGVLAFIATPAVAFAVFKGLAEHRLAALEASDNKQSDRIERMADALARIETHVVALREERR